MSEPTRRAKRRAERREIRLQVYADLPDVLRGWAGHDTPTRPTPSHPPPPPTPPRRRLNGAARGWLEYLRVADPEAWRALVESGALNQ